MKNKKWIVGGLILIILFSLGMIVGKVKAQGELERKLEIYLQVLSLVKNNYVEKNLDDKKLVYGSIKGLLTALDDPYTRFMEPTSYKEMRIRLRGKYSGIGIYIGIKDNQLQVISPIPGTPAFKAGLKAKDKILKIEDQATKDMGLEEAVSLIRGEQGTKVKLLVLRGSAKEPKEYSIKRENISIKSTEFYMLPDKIAYIKLTTFEKQNAPQEIEKAIMDARKKGAQGLILDLRGNGGGLLDNAIDIGSMFIRSGIIVQTVDREGQKEVKYSSGRILWWQPMAVLINEASASASEILAGALKDHKIATIVGTHSFGKASVQSVRVLADNSAVLLTIAKYLTPNGTDISKKGIQPDVLVELPTKEAEAEMEVPVVEGVQHDAQLDRAIELIRSQIKT
ncbi:S41 family peptidase [Candidatus Saganbacteria bacterium]|nr:S41 family peptidase [Candidatus Saganbacteria bacterium]